MIIYDQGKVPKHTPLIEIDSAAESRRHTQPRTGLYQHQRIRGLFSGFGMGSLSWGAWPRDHIFEYLAVRVALLPQARCRRCCTGLQRLRLSVTSHHAD